MNTKARTSFSGRSVSVVRVLLGIVVLAWASAPIHSSAQSTKGTLLKAHYRETKVLKDAQAAPVVVEEGTCVIDPQGRYRIDRQRGNSRTAEIVDYLQRRRTALDLDRRLAITGADSAVGPGTSALPGAPIIVESAAAPQRQRGLPLGTKVLPGGLEVEGAKFEFSIAQGGDRVTLTLENWYYPFVDRTRPPVMIEQRFEDARSITTREVTSVSELAMDENLFRIPANFSVQRKPTGELPRR